MQIHLFGADQVDEVHNSSSQGLWRWYLPVAEWDAPEAPHAI